MCHVCEKSEFNLGEGEFNVINLTVLLKKPLKVGVNTAIILRCSYFKDQKFKKYPLA